MRAQIASFRRGEPARKPAGTASSSSGSTTRGDAATQAAGRIRAIDPQDPDRERKAVRIFLECVFLAEWGADMAADPAFPRMVDHVEEQMQADPHLARAASEAAQALLRAA